MFIPKVLGEDSKDRARISCAPLFHSSHTERHISYNLAAQVSILFRNHRLNSKLESKVSVLCIGLTLIKGQGKTQEEGRKLASVHRGFCAVHKLRQKKSSEN